MAWCCPSVRPFVNNLVRSQKPPVRTSCNFIGNVLGQHKNDCSPLILIAKSCANLRNK